VPATPASRLTVALLVRPRGRIGEIAAQILTDFPQRLTRLQEVFLWSGAGEPRRVRVRRCWLSPSRGGQAIFHLEGCDSIEDAERFIGWQVQIPLEERMKLPRGSYYISELVGCEVWEVKEVREGKEAEEKTAKAYQFPTSSTSSTSLLGIVRDVDLSAGTPLLVVETPRGELLVPLAEEICRVIDLAARRIEAVLPEGLHELNM
jgi:16S rRNA processing protein RimM